MQKHSRRAEAIRTKCKSEQGQASLISSNLSVRNSKTAAEGNCLRKGPHMDEKKESFLPAFVNNVKGR
jgi:hypothetical protein